MIILGIQEKSRLMIVVTQIYSSRELTVYLYFLRPVILQAT